VRYGNFRIYCCREEGPQFPRETGCREAALILLKEKGLRYTPLREPLLLGRCVLCWEQEWDDCFEVTEFNTKESFIFKVSPLMEIFVRPHCKENPIYVFLFWELHELSPNFHIHVSVSDFYIPRISPQISLHQNMLTDPGNVYKSFKDI
jgi:hypothetical protein